MRDPIPIAYTIGSVKSADGTTIGYRTLGSGPGIVLVHGGMQASQNLMRLAAALSDSFTLYIPDRRGRGLSGPVGNGYVIAKEREDIRAVVEKTNARYLFGMSSGAIIALQASLTDPSIRKTAIYEPPFSKVKPARMDWLPRLEREIADNELNQAVVTFVKGIEASRVFSVLPRFILSRLIAFGIWKGDKVAGNDVPFRALIPTILFDLKLVAETAGSVESFKGVSAEVLLLDGSETPQYLRDVLDRLGTILPHFQRHTFEGLDHAGPDYGDPERVAAELRVFFGAPQDGQTHWPAAGGQ